MFSESILEKALLFSERKAVCKIVYRVSEQKISETIGTIRDIFLKNKTEWLVLENGLFISIESVFSIVPVA